MKFFLPRLDGTYQLFISSFIYSRVVKMKSNEGFSKLQGRGDFKCKDALPAGICWGEHVPLFAPCSVEQAFSLAIFLV